MMSCDGARAEEDKHTQMLKLRQAFQVSMGNSGRVVFVMQRGPRREHAAIFLPQVSESAVGPRLSERRGCCSRRRRNRTDGRPRPRLPLLERDKESREM